jgi:hypothetical protein
MTGIFEFEERAPTSPLVEFDQPHLGRALRRLMGFTPAALRRLDGAAAMSLSYKTQEFRRGKDLRTRRR